MNILKLAKYLKEFTLDEINMIAEFDCKTELEHLLNANKISFEQGVYKYVETKAEYEFIIVVEQAYQMKQYGFKKAINNFMVEYVQMFCGKETIRTYKSIFKTNIFPFFKSKKIDDIHSEDIIAFYNFCLKRGLSHRRTKNTLSLLNQFLRYCKNKGWIKNCCNFQVRRLTSKNEFSMNRIIFEGE